MPETSRLILLLIISSVIPQIILGRFLVFLKQSANFSLTAFLRFASYPSLSSQQLNNVTIEQWQAGFIKLSKNLIVMYLIIFFAFSTIAGLFLFNPFGTKETEAAW